MENGIQTSTLDGLTDVVGLLSKLIVDVDLAAATDLARIGNYSAAQSILAGVTNETVATDPVGLDLLARISAQQGHIAEAAGYWKRARQAAGNDSAYEQPLHRLASIQRRKVRTLLLNPSLVRMAAILILAILFFWFTNQENGVDRMIDGFSIATLDQQKRLATLEESSQSLRGRFEEEATNTSDALGKIDKQLTVMRESVQRLTAAAENVEAPLALTLDIPGVTVTSVKNGSALRFNDGLFAQGVTLNEGAREQIKAVGKALEPYVAEISLSVIGYTDDLAMPTGRRYGDNIGLGMARAMTIIGLLRQDGGLPTAILSARSEGEFKSPFPNDTAENRMRNRTVIISVSTRNTR